MLATVVSTAFLTGVLAPLQHEVGLLNEGLLFLLLTLLISGTWEWRVGILAAVLTNLALNFFFIEPLHRFTVQEPQNLAGLGVFLLVSVVGSSLLSSARTAADEARRRQAETQVLLKLSRTMIGQINADDALAALCDEVVAAFQAPGAAVLTRRSGGWGVLAAAGEDSARPIDTGERVMIEQAVTSGGVRRVGKTGLEMSRRIRIVGPSGARRFEQPSRGTAFAPLLIGDRILGVLRLDGPIGATAFREHPDHLLDAFASEAALAVQRVELAQAAAHADALAQADEMKSALMTSISHDLKTPLAGIKTSVSSLLDETVDWSNEDRLAFLSTIDSQADRLNRVISDILDLNRIESGVVAVSLGPVHALTLLEQVRHDAALVTQGREVTIDAPESCYVLADDGLLRQALVNLIENATKYSTAGRAIHMAAVPRDDVAEFVVQDEGPGIAASDLPHVFDRFYRAEEQSPRVKGSGLGLAIVKGFVLLSGGTVRVESERTGTRFVITLPAATPAKASA